MTELRANDRPVHPLVEQALARALRWSFHGFIPLGAVLVIGGLGLHSARRGHSTAGVAAMVVYAISVTVAFSGRNRGWPARRLALFCAGWSSVVIALAQLHVGPQMGVGAFWILVALLTQGFAGWRTTVCITALMFTLTIAQGWLITTEVLAPPIDMADPDGMLPWLRVATATAMAMIAGGLMGRDLLRALQESLAQGEAEQRARERSDAARRRAECAVEAQKHFEVLGKVAGGVAHDVNNALTVVLTSAELFRQPLTESERNECLDELTRGCLAATETSRQFLLLADRGRRNPKLHRIADLGRVLGRTLSRVMPATIKLKVTLQSERTVFLNAFDLQQAVLNLGLNARDAMPDGGTCELRIEDITLPNDRPGIAVRVQDGGVGIPPEAQARIFEPFFTTKESGKGTGLGLATVHRFAEDSGGHTEVVSAPGAGATISILLPQATAAEIDSTETVPAPRGDGQHVLFVDDREELLELCRRVLIRAGYRVTTAPGAAEANRALERDEPFDLLCLDGTAAGQRLEVDLVARFSETNPRRPVLLCSGQIEQTAGTPTNPATPSAFLAKPYSPEELLTAIGRLLVAK